MPACLHVYSIRVYIFVCVFFQYVCMTYFDSIVPKYYYSKKHQNMSAAHTSHDLYGPLWSRLSLIISVKAFPARQPGRLRTSRTTLEISGLSCSSVLHFQGSCGIQSTNAAVRARCPSELDLVVEIGSEWLDASACIHVKHDSNSEKCSNKLKGPSSTKIKNTVIKKMKALYLYA